MNKSFIIYLTVLLGLAGICAVIFVPAAVAAHGGPVEWAALARMAFGPFCHQDPGRSMAIGGVPLPVCTRCTGIYLGGLLGWGLWYLMPARWRDRAVSNWELIAGMGPLVVDGLINTTTLVVSPGWVRFGTGFVFGAMAARAVWPALKEAVIELFSSSSKAKIDGPSGGDQKHLVSRGS